jgi:hypothetical protein
MPRPCFSIYVEEPAEYGKRVGVIITGSILSRDVLLFESVECGVPTHLLMNKFLGQRIDWGVDELRESVVKCGWRDDYEPRTGCSLWVGSVAPTAFR